ARGVAAAVRRQPRGCDGRGRCVRQRARRLPRRRSLPRGRRAVRERRGGAGDDGAGSAGLASPPRGGPALVVTPLIYPSLRIQPLPLVLHVRRGPDGKGAEEHAVRRGEARLSARTCASVPTSVTGCCGSISLCQTAAVSP